MFLQLIWKKTIQESPEPEPEPEEPNNIDFSTIQKAISILGGSMSGRNQKDFIRKSELITLGADSTKLTSYGNNDYVKVGNIVKKASTGTVPKPIFLIDMTKTHNTASGIYDEISGYKLTPDSGATNGTVSFVTKDGYRCMKSNSKSDSSVFSMPYSKLSSRIKSLIKSGNFSCVSIFSCGSTSNSSSDRWGISALYDKCHLTNAWYPGNGFSCWFRPFNAGFNIMHFAFDKSLDQTKLGMSGYAVDRTNKKIRSTAHPTSSTYTNIFRIAETTYTGELSDGNVFSQIDLSSKLVVGRSQESYYYMLTDVYLRGIAIYDVALTEAQFKEIFNKKEFF